MAENKKHSVQQHHRHRHDRKQRDEEKTVGRSDESQTLKNSSTGRSRNSEQEKSAQLVQRLVIKEESSSQRPRDKRETKASVSLTGPNFLTDRRVSQPEMQRRQTWLQRTRQRAKLRSETDPAYSRDTISVNLQ